MSFNLHEGLSPIFIAKPTEDTFIPALAAVLTHLIKLTPTSHEGRNQITRFHGLFIPRITISEYLNRIAKYFRCSNECFVLSLVYIDRIVKLHEGFAVNSLNIHRLLITSVMLAAKFFDDVYFSNSFYARVGGVETIEMNLLEAHFLSLINYQLFVSPEEYDQYRQNVEDAIRPPLTIHPISPHLGFHMNTDYNENLNQAQNFNRIYGNNGKSHPSTRQSNSPQKLVSFNKRNGVNRPFNDHYTNSQFHSSMMMSKHLAPNQSLAPPFFSNVNCIQINRDATYTYYSGNYPSYEIHRGPIHPNVEANTMINEFNEDRFRDIRSSHNSIGYR